MTLPLITTQAVPGHSGVLLMARIVGQGGVLITQATISAVQVVVTDLTQVLATGSGPVNTYNPSISSVISNGLQQVLPWTQDSQANPGPDGLWGYNFNFVVPASCFANSGDIFQADARFTPVTGEAFNVSFKISTLQTFV